MSTSALELRFFAGTLELRGLGPDEHPPHLLWDDVGACHRAPALRYASLLLWLKRCHADRALDDRARQYEALTLAAALPPSRAYQEAAITAWREQQRRGVVVLPTGAGKTHVALLAMALCQRSTLVVVPTLELLHQWREALQRTFAVDVGAIGGGERDATALCVTTYDSASMQMEQLGSRYGLLVFDEVHHLCADTYAQAALMSLAPFRLGLSATPERADGKHSVLDELVGPICQRIAIAELEGKFLAPYDVVRVDVVLADATRAQYEKLRATYRAFVASEGIFVGSPQGFQTFVMRAAQSAEGRVALAAYRQQRRLAFCSEEKFKALEQVFEQHANERILVFVDDNATAYELAQRFFVPTITHQTKTAERKQTLQAFRDGRWPILVSARVLNEGVDVPEAEVAVIFSGSGSVREHVQRLGRILRPREQKRAVLYELVTRDTSEAHVSERRRQHAAYLTEDATVTEATDVDA